MRDEHQRFWQARDTYRARRAGRTLLVTGLLVEGLALAGMGLWGPALLVLTVQGLGLWGIGWLWRRVAAGVQAWWFGLAIALALSGGMLTGCESMAREVVKLHGVKVDPFPGPCAPESVQTGRCIPVAQNVSPPGKAHP
jgi:hypothetical protein